METKNPLLKAHRRALRNSTAPQPVVDETPLLWRRGEVLRQTSITGTVLDGLMKAGKFPRPIHLTERTVAWVAVEILAWIETRIDERDQRRIPNPQADHPHADQPNMKKELPS